MNLKHRVVRCGFALFVVFATSCCAAAETYEVHEVESRGEEFINKPLTIVGRFRSSLGDTLRLVDSNLDFRTRDDVRRVRQRGTPVLLNGRFVRFRGGVVFAVEHLEETGTEAEEFMRQRERLREGDIDRLADLERWAANRAVWYGDGELHELARAARHDRFDLRVAAARRMDDAEALVALAKDAVDVPRPNEETQALLHEAMWLRVENANGREALWPLAGSVRDRLSGTFQPLSGDVAWEDEYLAAPVNAFAVADSTRREEMARLLWSVVVERALSADRDAGSTGLARLEQRARELIPDRMGFVVELQRARISADSQQLENVSRGKLIALAAELEGLGDDDAARMLVRDWLAAKRGRLRDDDAEAFVSLAQDYAQLAEDSATAATLLQSALEVIPGMPSAIRSLDELGYVRINGEWFAADSREAEAAREQMRNQSIDVGSPEEDVVRLLRSPDRISRTVTSAVILEQWIYDGPPRLLLFLERNTATGLARVVRRVTP